MYRLMKSEKFTLEHLTSGLGSFYRHTHVECFRHLRAALGACEAANNSESRYYLLNESGQEYYGGTWID